jgi:cob(I)alamin adenosyltransferase
VALAAREALDGDIVRYLNRLSDALFVWSRWTSRQLGVAENLWESNKGSTGRQEELP